ncbi:ecdysteroid kinase domain-containing protein [Phthorimaea operculella]|nr:ecdysteroid kinase domain-containing protein [Phthorimaea operculella]
MADAESIIRDLFASIASEHDFNNYELVIKPVSSGGANFTSALFLVTVKCPGKKDVELFAKVANMGELMREHLNGKRLYDLEVFFYTKIAKIYRELELKANVADEDRLTIPKFYGYKSDTNEETVIMQNLTADGFKMHKRQEPVSWEFAARAIENLAKFHALSFAYQQDNPEEYEKLCEDLVFVPIGEENANKETLAKQLQECLDIIKKAEYKPRVTKLMEEVGGDVWMFKRPLAKKVMNHGDFRPDNMMYREKDNNVEVMLLDYQTLHVGCPAADLLYFEASATDGAFRAKHHERLINHYYEELSAAMQRLGVDPVKTYSREQFDSELKQMMPIFLVLSMSLLRMVLVDADNAPKVDDGAGMDSFANIQITEAFVERFNEVVEDCARWGVI